ncbi:MAG: hypothetical protein K2Y21_16200 [Phycisphaerales bacterium]|nr:hypothetical protein [Phycisphaerales bacterium]
MSGMLLGSCTRYTLSKVTIRDESGQPLRGAIVTVHPSRYVMRIPSPRTAIARSDEGGSVTVTLPDTSSYRIEAWIVSPTEFVSRARREVDSDGSSMQYPFHNQSDPLKVLIEKATGEASPQLSWGSEWVDGSDVFVSKNMKATRVRTIRTFKTPDGRSHDLVLRLELNGDGFLTIGDTEIRVSGSAADGRRLCPSPLVVRALVDSDRQVVALRVRGGVADSDADCWDRVHHGGGSSGIDAVFLYKGDGTFAVGGDSVQLIAGVRHDSSAPAGAGRERGDGSATGR